MQLALGAEGVDDAIGDDRHGARTFVEAEVVSIVRGVRVTPDRCARLGVERLEHFLVADAVEEQHAVLDDRGPGKCLTDLLPPDDLRAGRSPRLGQRRAGIRAVAIRSKKLRPIGGDDRRRRERNQSGSDRETRHADDFTATGQVRAHRQRAKIRRMSIERILLKGGCVLTLDPDIGNYRQGDVLIEGTKITSVGPRLRVLDAEVIDCSDMIVMPGFIDTHRHIWEGILKNIAPDALLDEYFRDILGVLAPVYRPQDAYAGNLVSALGAIDCGVTTLLDWSHIQNTPEHTDAAISALQESGLRSVFAYGTPNLDMAAWWHDSSLKHPTDVKRVATQYFSSPDQC